LGSVSYNIRDSGCKDTRLTLIETSYFVAQVAAIQREKNFMKALSMATSTMIFRTSRRFS
jgi:hypothetical protein